MNFAEARQIPVQTITERLGGKKSHSKKDEIWYFSPFRPDEKTASFKVNEKINTWYDFAEGKGGSGLDLWLDYHGQDRKDGKAIKAALDSLKNLAATLPAGKQNRRTGGRPAGKQTASRKAGEPPRFKALKEPGKIWMKSLKEEIGRRGLTLAEVEPYIKQVWFEDTTTRKKYNGLCFSNDKGGLEVTIPNPEKGENFKTSIGPKTITTIATGSNRKAAVFEGMWDFQTWLKMNQGSEGFEIYILNSLSFIGELARQLTDRKDTIHSVFLFLDNDDAGEKATHEIAYILEPEGFLIGAMNHLYDGHKDLNDYWTKDPAARRPKSDQPRIMYDTAWSQVNRKKDRNGPNQV